MASVSEHRPGQFIIRVQTQEGEKRISGFTKKQEAYRICGFVTALELAQKTGGLLTRHIAEWASEVAEKNPKLHKRLVEIGLMEPAEEKRTLGELFERHRGSLRNALPETLRNIRIAEANLEEFLGRDYEITKIDFDKADEYAQWLHETPLNRRKKGTCVVYREATVNRRIKRIRQIFHYAKKIGWITENPFQFVKGGDSVNPETWEYVEREKVEMVINASRLPKWRAIIALGRFAGVRGASELYEMIWEDIHWSCGGKPGSLLIRGEKTKRYRRQPRTVPMHPTVERELSTLFALAGEKGPHAHVFPNMKKHANTNKMVLKQVVNAGVPVWKDIWYNLRKSFCCDLMEKGVDPVVYEAVTGHRFITAMKHYQIPYPERLQKGYEKVFEAFGYNHSVAEEVPIGKEETVSLPTSSRNVLGDAHRIAYNNTLSCKEIILECFVSAKNAGHGSRQDVLCDVITEFCVR